MLKLIVIGCGGISSRWINAVKTGGKAEIAALVDVRREACERAKEAFGLDVPVFTDVAEALREVKADAAAVLTPPALHLPIVRECLAAGLDVLSEKPLSDNIGDAREIVRLAKESGRRVLVMQNRRYLSGIRTLRKAIDAGKIGDITMVNVDMFLGAYFGRTDFRYEMAHPLIVDMLVHTFDEARYLLGDREIVSAYCQEFNPADSRYHGAANAVCIFETADGIVITVRGSWVSHAENTSSNGKWHIESTDGAAAWDGEDELYLSYREPFDEGNGYFEETGRREAYDITKLTRTEHNGCIDAMLDALADGTALDTECFGNIKSIEMVFACLKSSAEGRKVMMSEL